MTLTRALSAECWVKNKIGGEALDSICRQFFKGGDYKEDQNGSDV